MSIFLFEPFSYSHSIPKNQLGLLGGGGVCSLYQSIYQFFVRCGVHYSKQHQRYERGVFEGWNQCFYFASCK